MRTLIAISFYNARPADALAQLIAAIEDEAAGAGCDIAVSVNAARDEPLLLPPSRLPVAIAYRENTGMNIGAWDGAWRHWPDYEAYIFLQDECVIAKPGWLAAYLDALADPKAGIVGSSLKWNTTWERLFERAAKLHNSRIYDQVLTAMKTLGIDPGDRGTHLQSLVWAMRREVIERIGGFVIGADKRECIAAEVGICRQVAALGLDIREVGHRFEWVTHPQWDRRLGPIREAGVAAAPQAG